MMGGFTSVTVRRRLAENDLKPWRRDMWCIPQVDAEYVARMEEVLDLYAEKPDPKRPVVCFDESPTQLIGEVRAPIPAEPGQLERYDCEYRRNGTVNLFVFLDAHRSWRKVKITDRRAAQDFAACMRDLTDVHFPKAERIRVVLDNLSTHSPAALYQAMPASEARRVLRRLECHYTPKHASWLNMVEIEIGVLRSQCLARRIDKPIKAICRELRVSRKMVRKVIRSGATELHYERETQPLPKIGLWRERLDSLLLVNDSKASRERLTLIRIFEALRGQGYDGSYDVQRLEEPSTGAGEDVTGATAAAIANAFFDGTGVRLRQLIPVRRRQAM